MEERFVVMPSTIVGAGNGLFLRAHTTIAEDIHLPYSGRLVTGLKDFDLHDDKILGLREGIHVRESENYVFEISGNNYTYMVAMCNERLAQDMVYANQGEFKDSGMVKLRSLFSQDKPVEVTLLYSDLPMKTSEFLVDIEYRDTVRRSILTSLWMTQDGILVQLSLPWYNNMRTALLRIFDDYTIGGRDLNDLESC